MNTVKLLFYFCLLSFATIASGQSFEISNAMSRVDVDGDTIDVHDGRVIKFEDRYYWYGTTYGKTTGFVRSNHYQVYSSPDMKTWKKHGPILPEAKSGVYYRPHVIYNAKKKQYVLWYNWYPKLWDGKFGVAVSDTPTGPFKVVNDDVKVKNSELGVGDFNLFTDDDAKAYIMYNTISGHRLSVEELKDNYTASTMNNGGFIADHCEAGSIFKRNKTYYLLTDYTCCFCTQGSGARVYTSDSPLGKYKLQGNINRTPGTESSRLTDGDSRPTVYQAIKKSKEDTFPSIQLELPEASTIQRLVISQYTGNRGGQCGDTLATAVHEFRTAPKITIHQRVGGDWHKVDSEAKVLKTTLTNEISFFIPAKLSDGFKINFDSSYNLKQIQIIETTLLSKQNNKLNPNQIRAYVLDKNPLHTAPIIPAQQTFVMPLMIDGKQEFLWMGDLWGSAPDNIKGHDMQYWSSPMEFYPNGMIKRMEWENQWSR